MTAGSSPNNDAWQSKMLAGWKWQACRAESTDYQVLKPLFSILFPPTKFLESLITSKTPQNLQASLTANN